MYKAYVFVRFQGISEYPQKIWPEIDQVVAATAATQGLGPCFIVERTQLLYIWVNCSDLTATEAWNNGQDLGNSPNMV